MQSLLPNIASEARQPLLHFLVVFVKNIKYPFKANIPSVFAPVSPNIGATSKQFLRIPWYMVIVMVVVFTRYIKINTRAYVLFRYIVILGQGIQH